MTFRNEKVIEQMQSHNVIEKNATYIGVRTFWCLNSVF